MLFLFSLSLLCTLTREISRYFVIRKYGDIPDTEISGNIFHFGARLTLCNILTFSLIIYITSGDYAALFSCFAFCFFHAFLYKIHLHKLI